MMLVCDNNSHHLLMPVSFSLSFHLPGSMRHFDRAALFIEACLKYGVMEANDSSNILFENPLLYSDGNLKPKLAALLTLSISATDVHSIAESFCHNEDQFRCSMEHIKLPFTCSR